MLQLMETIEPNIQEPPVQTLPPAKMKDPKKQEAGRLGAAARKAKEKRVLEELTAVRDRVFSENDKPLNTDVPSTRGENNVDDKQTRGEVRRGLGTNDWFAAIGLAVLLAGVLWFKPYAKAPSVSLPQQVPPPVSTNVDVVPRQSRDVFEME